MTTEAPRLVAADDDPEPRDEYAGPLDTVDYMERREADWRRGRRMW